MSRRRRSLIIAAIAVVVVLAGVAIAVFLVTSPALTAAGALSQYVSAIENGDLGHADQLVRAPSGSQHPVSGTALADPANRITDVSTTVVSTSGSTATGHVDFTLGGHSYRATLKLATDSPQLGFLPDWRVLTPLTTTITLKVPATGTAVVNGVEADLDGKLRVTVYPGHYAVGLASDNQWFTSPTVQVEAGTSAVSVTPDVAPTAALGDEVTKQVNAKIDACVAMPTPTPSGCRFSDLQPGTMAGFTWKLVSYPTVAFLDPTHFFLNGGEVTGNYVYTHAPNIVNRPEADPVALSGPGSVSFTGSQAVVTLG